MEWYSTVLRRAEVKEHFKFVILRDNEIEKWRNRFGRDDSQLCTLNLSQLIVRDV